MKIVLVGYDGNGKVIGKIISKKLQIIFIDLR